MARLIYSAIMSLDGYTADADGRPPNPQARQVSGIEEFGACAALRRSTWMAGLTMMA
jgi:hypothetical protein